MTTPDQPQYAPTPAPKAASGIYIRLADLLVAGGAIIILLFSWAPVVSFSDSDANAAIGRSMWSWLSPLGLFVILGALILLASAVIDTWWKRDKQIVGVNRHHVQTGVALFVLLVVFGMCFANPYDIAGFGANGFGVSYGGVISLLGALVAAGGAILNHFNQLQNPIGLPNVSVRPAAPIGPGAYPPAQGGYAPPQPQGYAPPTQGYAPTPVDPTLTQPGYAPPQPDYPTPPAPVDPQGPPTA